MMAKVKLPGPRRLIAVPAAVVLLPLIGCSLSPAVLINPALKICVYTYHYDNFRSGCDSSEVLLTPANVNAGTFGKIFSVQVDGDVYAQPLYVSNLGMPDGGVYDVVFVATAHDGLYAIDAAGGRILWYDSFIDPDHGITAVPADDMACDDIVPEAGIIGTPVIDGDTQTLYVVSKVKNTAARPPTYAQYLHAIDLSTGHEKFNGPVLIAGSVKNRSGEDILFDPLLNNQRAALTLDRGIVYICWSSHCDTGDYHGWIIGYDASDLRNVSAVLVTTPNGTQGGIWMAAGGMSADGTYLYVTIGNGTFGPAGDWGSSALKMLPGSLAVVDAFTPFNQEDLSSVDYDFGSAEPLLIPQPGSAGLLLVTADKAGTVYVLDPARMGGYSPESDRDVEELAPGDAVMNNMAYFSGRLYIGANNEPLQAFTLSSGKFDEAPSSASTHIFGDGGDDGQGANPVLSANGSKDGIVWALDNHGYGAEQPAVLYAYDAADLSRELYDSNQGGGSDLAGPAVKFTSPVVADGRVFVPGGSLLTVYGLK